MASFGCVDPARWPLMGVLPPERPPIPRPAVALPVRELDSGAIVAGVSVDAPRLRATAS